MNARPHVAGPDAMRAVCALSVMCAHLVDPALPAPLAYVFTGAPAVIAFFVISGFCIHYPYRSAEVPARAFLASRAIRILPPTMVALGIAQTLGIKAYNFVDGYILWSIVCELVYYALYPMLRRAAAVLGWAPLLAGSVLASYTIVLALGSDQFGNIHIYGPSMNWLVLLPAWLGGAFVADRGPWDVGGPIWAWRLGVACLASVLFWLTMNTPIGFYLTLIPFSAIAALWLCAELTSARRRQYATLEAIGAWSFSIYLLHIPASVLLGRMHVAALLVRMHLYSAAGIAAGTAALSLLVCYAFYRAVELPAHRLARAAWARLSPSSAPSDAVAVAHGQRLTANG